MPCAFEVEIVLREDGTVGPPLTVRNRGYLLILDGFADGVAGYRAK